MDTELMKEVEWLRAQVSAEKIQREAAQQENRGLRAVIFAIRGMTAKVYDMDPDVEPALRDAYVLDAILAGRYEGGRVPGVTETDVERNGQI